MGQSNELALVLTLNSAGLVTGFKTATGEVISFEGTAQNAANSASAGFDKVSKSASQMATNVSQSGKQVGGELDFAAEAAKRVAAAVAAISIARGTEDVIMFAANVEQADRALVVIGNNTGHAAAEMLKYRDAVRDMNITTMAATGATTAFARAGLPLDKLGVLAQGAQGAAIAYSQYANSIISSSEAYQTMIRAILTGQTIELHQMGITVSQRELMRMNDAGITEHQRKLLLLQAVLKELEPLNSLYANSLDLAAKKISSSKRPLEELKLALGNLFLPELTAGATAFYETVSGGMKWVREHTFDLLAMKNMLKDTSEGLYYGVGALVIYTASVVTATAVTGGFTAGAGVFTGVLATMRMNLSLTGAEAIITSTKVGVLGETITTTSSQATLGLMSIKAAFGVLAAFMVGWEIGKLLNNQFESVRNVGTQVVWGLIRGWKELGYTLQETIAILDFTTSSAQTKTILKQISDEREAWRKEWEKSKKDQLRDNVNPPGAPAPTPYKDDTAAIAKGKEDERKRLADEAKRLSEQQHQEAMQYLKDEETAHNEYLAYSKAYDDRRLAQIKNQSALELTALDDRHAQGLLSEKQYLDGKYSLQMVELKKELAIAQKAYDDAQGSVKKADTMATGDVKDKEILKVWTDANKKFEEAGKTLDAVNAKVVTIGLQHDLGIDKVARDMNDQFEQLNIQLLTTEGRFIDAAAAQKAFDASRPDYKKLLKAWIEEDNITAGQIIQQTDKANAIKATSSAYQEAAQKASRSMAEYENRLTIVDQLERAHSITATDAATQRADLLEKERIAQQAAYDSIQGNEPAAILARQQTLATITAINGKLIDQREIASGFAGGVKIGMKDYVASLEWGFDRGKSLAREAFTSMENWFEDLFTGKAKLSFKSLTSWIGGLFAKLLAQMATQALAMPIIVPVLQAVGGAAGGIQNAVLGVAGGASSMGGASIGVPTGLLYGGYKWGSNAATGLMGETGYAGEEAFAGLGAPSGWQYAGAGIGAAAGLYGMYQAYRSGSMPGGAFSGMAAGASIGSIVPGVGTIAGAIIGTVVGALAGALGGKKVHNPEFAMSYNYNNTPTGMFQDGEWHRATTESGVNFSTNHLPLNDPQMLALASGVERYITDAKKAMESLGLDVSGFSKQWAAQIGDLKDLTVEELQKKIQEMMAGAIDFFAGDDLKKFERNGEDAATALTRLTTSLSAVNGAAALFNMQLMEVTVQGADAASSLVDMMGGLDAFNSKTSLYFQNFYTDTERAQLQAQAGQKVMAAAFGDLGMAIPATRDGFKALVSSLDVTTESGQKTFASLMNIAAAANSVYTMSEQAADAARAAADAFALNTTAMYDNAHLRDLRNNGLGPIADIQEKIYSNEQGLSEARAKGLDTVFLQMVQTQELTAIIKEKLITAQGEYNKSLADTATKQIDAAKQISSAWHSAYDSITSMIATLKGGDLSTLSPGDKLSLARSNFDAAYQAAMAGDASQAANISSLGQAFAEASRGYNASGSAYTTDYNHILSAMAEVQGLAQATYTQQDAQINLLQQQVDRLSSIANNTADASQALYALTNAGWFHNLTGANLPSFDVGSPEISHDMVAKVHRSETIIDPQSSAILRKYGIRVQAQQADASTLAALLESNRLKEEEIQVLKLQLKVLQDGFNQLLKEQGKGNASLKTLESSSRRERAA